MPANVRLQIISQPSPATQTCRVIAQLISQLSDQINALPDEVIGFLLSAEAIEGEPLHGKGLSMLLVLGVAQDLLGEL